MGYDEGVLEAVDRPLCLSCVGEAVDEQHPGLCIQG